MTKRITLIAGAVALAIVIVVVSTWLYVGRAGTTELENWIGRQIVGVLQSYINPQVRFENLDYQAPRTVVLENLAFTSEGLPILHIGWARLELAEIPQRGKPIRIQQVDFETPKLQLVTDEQGHLIGWSDFVKQKAIEEPETVPPDLRLSEVLVLRHLGIRNGEVIYESRGGSRDRMTLPGINLQLETPPIEDAPGWYQLVGQLKRDPLIDLQLQGRINLDTGELDIARLEMAASLSEEQYQTVPPSLQNFLRRHEVRGAFTASVKGHIPLGAPEEFAGTFQADLRDGRVRYGQTVLPIEMVSVSGSLPEGGIDISLVGVNLADEQQAFFSMRSLQARLAGIPGSGEPLVIERFEVEEPHVVFASRPQGGLQGWSQLSELSERGPGRFVGTEIQAEDIVGAVRLERFQLTGGAITYQPVEAKAVTLDGIDVSLSSTAQQDSADQIGLEGKLQAGSLLSANLRAQLDTRSAVLTVEQFEAATDINAQTYEQLPPKARDWMTRHEFRAKLIATGEGTIPLNNPSETTFLAAAQLSSANMVLNGIEVPLEQLRARLRMPERRIEASATNFQLVHEGKPFFSLDELTSVMSFEPDNPLVIEELVADSPMVALIASSDGGFAGWNRLTQDGPATRPAPAQEASAQERTDETELPFRIRQMQVQAGTLAIASSPDAEPMTINGIDLAARPAGEQDGLDVLQVNGTVDDDLVRAEVAGTLTVPTRQLQVDQFQANTTITAEQYAQLPPELSEVLARYALAGELAVMATGMIPLDDPQKAQGKVRADLSSASVSYQGLNIPVDNASLELTMPAGPLLLQARGLAVNQGETTLARAQALSLNSAGLPWKQEPARFERLRIENPTFELTRRPEGGLAGWSELGAPSAQPESSVNTTAQATDSGVSIDRLEIVGADLRYTGPETDGSLVVQGVEAILQTQPVQDSDASSFTGQVRRPDLLSIDFKGVYQPAESILEFSQLRADLNMQEGNLAQLPEETRESLQRNQIRGELTANWKGVVPLGGERPLRGQLEVNARDATLLYAGLTWPVGSLQLQADLPDGPLAAGFERFAAKSDDLEILSIAAGQLRIARLPTAQAPMQIERIDLQQPRLVLVSVDEGFAGWNRILNGGAESPPAAARGGEAEQRPGPRIRQMRITNGELVYAQSPAEPPMSLPGVNLNLATHPDPNVDAYQFDGQVRHGEALNVDLRGRYFGTQRMLELEGLRIRGELSRHEALPPSMQAFLREHQVRGGINLEASGRIPLDDNGMERIDGQLTATAREAYFVYGDTQWPIRQLDLNAQARQGQITARANADAFGGSIQVNGNAVMPQGGQFSLDWRINGVRLDQIMQAVQQEDRRYEGVLASNGTLNGRLRELPQSLSGKGELSIEQGRLLRLPIIQGVVTSILTSPFRLDRRPSDRAQASWQFRPDHLQVERMTVNSPLITIDGEGQMFYDQRVDLRLNAEPAQATEILPKALGEIGSIIEDVGKLGGRLITYHVTGTISEPRVVPVPLVGRR